MERSLAEKLEAAVEALRKCEERSLAGQFALEVMHEVRSSRCDREFGLFGLGRKGSPASPRST